jgi:predicted nuclease of predicted toxin-antitoxin system
MRFLCNENVPRALVEALSVLGHDVKWGRKERPGIDDREVLQRSIAENRVCITFDKDFGELVANSAFNRAIPGVILLRLPAPAGHTQAAEIASVISGRSD